MSLAPTPHVDPQVAPTTSSMPSLHLAKDAPVTPPRRQAVASSPIDSPIDDLSRVWEDFDIALGGVEAPTPHGVVRRAMNEEKQAGLIRRSGSAPVAQVPLRPIDAVPIRPSSSPLVAVELRMHDFQLGLEVSLGLVWYLREVDMSHSLGFVLVQDSKGSSVLSVQAQEFHPVFEMVRSC